jgi:hypothetical protein
MIMETYPTDLFSVVAQNIMLKQRKLRPIAAFQKEASIPRFDLEEESLKRMTCFEKTAKAFQE